MPSYHDRGAMFGTDGHVTWTEPELFDVPFVPSAGNVPEIAAETTTTTQDLTERMF